MSPHCSRSTNCASALATGRSVSQMVVALSPTMARLRMFRVSFLSVCRRKGRRYSSHSSVANVPQMSVALSHPGMALGQVSDCVGMPVLLRASGGEARSTAASERLLYSASATEPFGDTVDAHLRTRRILIAARRTGDADSANNLLASHDRQR